MININELIIDLLYKSVISEGGDGDAIWLVKYTKLNDIVPLLEKYNLENKTNWIIDISREDSIHWGDNQEWVIIINNSTDFIESPTYTTLRINY